MPKTCLLCNDEINEDGWGQYAYWDSDRQSYIHHGCRPPNPIIPVQARTHAPSATDRTRAESLYLTLPDAAALLGVSPQTLRRRIKDGTLPAFRLAGGQTILIERALLLKLLHRL